MSRTLESGSDYAEAGRLHLADARELLQHPTSEPFHNRAHVRHLRGAMYLGGYAVECALKSYLIRKHGVTTFDEVIPLVSATLSIDLWPRLHDLGALWRAADFRGVNPAVTGSMGQCASWHVGWRYDPSVANARRAAETFFKAAQTVALWVGKQR